MSQFSCKKIPAKGSFSVNYSGSKSPNARVVMGSKQANEENSEDDSILSQDLTNMCQYAQMALEKTSEVQEDIVKLLETWDSEGKGLLNKETELLNNMLVESGFRPIRIQNIGNYIHKTFETLTEIQALRNELLKTKVAHNELLKTIEMHKKINKDSENQIKLMKARLLKLNQPSVIKPNPVVQDLKKIFNCDKVEDLYSKAKSLTTIFEILPKFEAFIEEICKEFVPEVDYEQGFSVHPEALRQVFERIRGFKAVLQDLSNFKINVYALLDLKISGNDEVVYLGLTEMMKLRKELNSAECKNFSSFFENLGSYIKHTQAIFRKIIALYGTDVKLTDLTLRHEMQQVLKTKI